MKRRKPDPHHLAAFRRGGLRHVRNQHANHGGAARTSEPLAPGASGADARRGDDVATRAHPAAILDPVTCDTARAEITSWPHYAPTPLYDLPGLADALGLGAVLYKDEGPRFGLGSFKALGGAYAILHVLRAEIGRRTGSDTSFSRIRRGEHAAIVADVTVVTATDGNHGRSVAWGAQRFGCDAKIYMHVHVSESRADAVRAYGAEVVRVDGDYDESVRQAALDAERNGWFVVSDTAYGTYTEIPRQVMAGYTTVAAEALQQIAPESLPTHVFVPGGVGGIAAALCSCFRRSVDTSRPGAIAPRFIVVEPERAACLFASARDGRLTSVPIRRETVMAGLSCGEPSLLAWPILAAWADDFVTVPDDLVAPAMRLLAEAPFGDPQIVAGESAVAGLCALLASAAGPATPDALGLTYGSRVLIIGTEGATDPEIYRRLTGSPP